MSTWEWESGSQHMLKRSLTVRWGDHVTAGISYRDRHHAAATHDAAVALRYAGMGAPRLSAACGLQPMLKS